MEDTLVPKAGYPVAHIHVAGFRRSFSPADIAHNIKALSLIHIWIPTEEVRAQNCVFWKSAESGRSESSYHRSPGRNRVKIWKGMLIEMQQRSNLAYDLERFENRAPVITKVSAGKEKVLSPVKVVVVALLLVALTSTVPYGRVVINELNMQYNAANAELNELKSEGVRMQSELESRLSLKTIEDIAVGEYGMVKPDSSQVGYIQLNSENKIETTEKQDSIFTKIADFIGNLFE